ncbi:uncharacterized protein BDZ99DRAFT_214209 [Mytilinidion resinicola]|uniref:Uncharacterized protein n=1 Tax=Mytilinidion resinicola TaxID=574789 RepID=A0A6A6Y1F8_9PEZI|nr:uncharacterized protein BDZ99DRAFT_214209 [Mytilinidion resinicola]KAF2801844.1 hypothetical protein BDZ99DRAFT_214209 [Mytilinidion resinicola]
MIRSSLKRRLEEQHRYQVQNQRHQRVRFLDLPGKLWNSIYTHCLAGHEYSLKLRVYTQPSHRNRLYLPRLASPHVTLFSYTAFNNLARNISPLGRAHIQHLQFNWYEKWACDIGTVLRKKPGVPALLAQFERLRTVDLRVSAKYRTARRQSVEAVEFVKRHGLV